MSWVLLVPPGVEVDVRTSGAVTEPILASAEQLQTVALAAAKLIEQGLEVDVGALLAAITRKAAALAPPSIPMGDGVATTTNHADNRMWSCACGMIFTLASGGELALQRHQATCGVHQTGVRLPTENRIEGS